MSVSSSHSQNQALRSALRTNEEVLQPSFAPIELSLELGVSWHHCALQ